MIKIFENKLSVASRSQNHKAREMSQDLRRNQRNEGPAGSFRKKSCNTLTAIRGEATRQKAAEDCDVAGARLLKAVPAEVAQLVQVFLLLSHVPVQALRQGIEPVRDLILKNMRE